MSTLPKRKDEAWRYSDLAALGEVWPGGEKIGRSLSIPAGQAARLDDALAGAGWRNDAVAITVGAGGTLTGFIEQGLAAGAVATQDYAITLAAGAAANIVILNHGGRFGRIALDVTLHEGADFQLGGVIIGGEAQTLEIITTVRHAGPGATSRQVVRTVLGGRAIGSYLGKVAVAREGQKTDAAQSFKALLLERGATANAKPELEIFADDVKCAHGATVGELDKTALFYLESRGVPPQQAKALLTRAFLSDALAAMADDEREAAETRVTALLDALLAPALAAAA